MLKTTIDFSCRRNLNYQILKVLTFCNPILFDLYIDILIYINDNYVISDFLFHIYYDYSSLPKNSNLTYEDYKGNLAIYTNTFNFLEIEFETDQNTPENKELPDINRNKIAEIWCNLDKPQKKYGLDFSLGLICSIYEDYDFNKVSKVIDDFIKESLYIISNKIKH